VTDSADKDSNTSSNRHKVPLNGTIDEVGEDLHKIKEMGADHVIFGLTGIMDLKQVIDTAKQLSRYAR
jgi:hypothetical protein